MGARIRAARKDSLISWKYVQPLSSKTSPRPTRSRCRSPALEIHELPSEDLADVLEELPGPSRRRCFRCWTPIRRPRRSLITEPRAQRQIVADLPPDRARVDPVGNGAAEVADLLSALPWDDRIDLLALLPAEQADRVRRLLGTSEATARSLVSQEYVAMPGRTTAAEALARLRATAPSHKVVTYIHIVTEPEGVLAGVVDLRQLVLPASQRR